MKKIVSYVLLLILGTGLSGTAYDGKAVRSKQKYNTRVINRVSAKLMDAITNNQTHRKKQYYIQDNDVSRFFHAYFSSVKASQLLAKDYEALKQDGYESLFNDYISTLRSNYLPEQYKDYQIYFVVAGLFYTPDINQTDVTQKLDWEEVRPISFDKIPATGSTSGKKSNSITEEFEKRIQLGVYNNLIDKKLIKDVSIDFSVSKKTIVFYKWLLFDIDIEESSLESFLKEDVTEDLNHMIVTRPVIFMADGYMFNSKATDVIPHIQGLQSFLSSDRDYSDILSQSNMPYQRNKLMKDVTNAFIYFYQLNNSLIPADFCSRSDEGKGKVLDILATSYKNSPSRTWEESPYRNPVLFLNISWDTRKCIFDYLLNKSSCSDAGTGGNACEEMLVDAMGGAKTAVEQQKILEYFNNKDNFKKLYSRIDDWGGVDNYAGAVFALTSMAGKNRYWDKEKNSISDALFNFDKREIESGPLTNIRVGFREEIREPKGLHFEIVTTTTKYNVSTVGAVPTSRDPAEKFDCAPFTPVPFVYSYDLPFNVQKPDGTTPINGEIVAVPALYLQWLIRTDFKIDVAKTGVKALLVLGLYSGVGTLTTATSGLARLWAAGDVFFSSTLLLTTSDSFTKYVRAKWGETGLEVLSTINTIGAWYGGAYLGRAALKTIADRLEQKAFQEALEQMMKDEELRRTFGGCADAIDEAAAEMDKAGWELSKQLANSNPVKIEDLITKKVIGTYYKYDHYLQKGGDYFKYNNFVLGKSSAGKLEQFGREIGANAWTSQTDKVISRMYNLLDRWSFEESIAKILDETVGVNQGKILFDIKGVYLEKGITGGMVHTEKLVFGGYVTELELQMILRDRNWYNNTIFHEAGRVLTAEEIATKGLKYLGK